MAGWMDKINVLQSFVTIWKTEVGRDRKKSRERLVKESRLWPRQRDGNDAEDLSHFGRWT